MSILKQQIDKYLDQKFSQFHSPAHAGLWDSRDLSEVEGLDDLQNPQGAIARAQEEAAQIFGAAKTLFLVAGASQGMQIACLALKMSLKNSKPVLVARNVHKSTLAGIILAGLDIEWLEPEWNQDLGLYTRVDLSNQKKINENYSGIIISNPSYEGFYSSLPQLEIPLVVDEAHGAHFHFNKSLPKPALEYGADLSVQSWHKTLGSFTQTGVIHLNKNSKIPEWALDKAYKLIQTTSPSYLLLENIANTVKIYKEQGLSIINETLDLIKELKLNFYKNDDPFRKIFTSPSLTGEELDQNFEKSGIAVEAIGYKHVLAFINVGNTKADINKLNSLANLDLSLGQCLIEKPREVFQETNMRESFFNNNKSRIYAPCPPGIAIEVPGQNERT